MAGSTLPCRAGPTAGAPAPGGYQAGERPRPPACSLSAAPSPLGGGLHLLLQLRRRHRAVLVDVLAVEQHGRRAGEPAVAEGGRGLVHPGVVGALLDTTAEGGGVEPVDLLRQFEEFAVLGVVVAGLLGLVLVEHVVVRRELPGVLGAGRGIGRVAGAGAAHVAVDDRRQVVLDLELAGPG